jgi:uncharacterized protein (TIGR03790 family)
MQRAQGLPALLLLLAAGTAAEEERHPEVLLETNGASEIYIAISRYYASRRGVPAGNVVALDLPLADSTLTTKRHETVSRADYERLVRDPVAAFLTERGLTREVTFIVTTKGVPLRVRAAGEGDLPFSQRTWASVDAELALLFSGKDGTPGTISLVNPYFGVDQPFEAWRRRHPDAPLRYLVTRLTGYQTDLDPVSGVPRDVKRLIDRAVATEPADLYLIDEDPEVAAGLRAGNSSLLLPAAAALRALGARVHHDRGAPMAAGQRGIVGYASWGSNDRAPPPAPFYGEVGGRDVPGSFGGRAIAVDLVSTNARSFSYPTRYGQSLLADLVRLGVAGAAGHVDEPTLAAVARPYLLLSAHARGAPAAEAYFRSLPYLGWTNVYVGDPLMRVSKPAQVPADRDGDGHHDPQDNCLWLPNPDQRDTDGDGFGNLCDPDLDGNGRVESTRGAGGLSDLERLQRSTATGLYVPNHDLDGDGRIDQRDLGIAQLYLGLPPGPSGLAPQGPEPTGPGQEPLPRRR